MPRTIAEAESSSAIFRERNTIGTIAYSSVFNGCRRTVGTDRRKPRIFIGDNVDQKPAHHKKGDALNQKPLFVSAPSSILRQDRQIGRIQENGMKSSWADIGAEEAAEADTVQLLLCLFRPVVIQFNAVALAVRPQGEPEQGVPCSTAWVNQVGRVLCGKDNAVGDIPHMSEVRGVMPQPDIVHQAPDD